MSASLLWMIVGLLLLIIELFSMTFFLMWIATAALLTALVALFIPLAWLQWLIFAVVAVLLLVITRPLARRLHGPVSVPSNVDALVGQEAVVLETIDEAANSGRVRVRSDEWRARGSGRIPQGETVIVTGVEGATLLVEPKAQTPDAGGNGG
jgi:membrane protein implicated in regulation of membrane protease activity